jgi:hypothetical protein
LAGAVVAGAALLQHQAGFHRTVEYPLPATAMSRPWAAVRAAAGDAPVVVPGPVVLSEVMTVNADVIFDETRKAADWIELHNRSDRLVPLGGWSLAQGRRTRGRWILPDVTLPPHGHLVVWASGRDLVGSAASRRVWLIVDPDAKRHEIMDDRWLARPLWPQTLRNRTVRRVLVRVRVPETGRYTLWLTARALDSPWGKLGVAVNGEPRVPILIAAGDRARHLRVQRSRDADHALTAGVHDIDIRASAGRVEVRHVALVRAAAPTDPLGLHLHASFRLKQAGEPVTLLDPSGRVRDHVRPPALGAGLSYQRQPAARAWRAGAPSPGGVAMLPAPDLSAYPSVSAGPLRVTLARAPGVDAFHYSRDGAVPTVRHPRLEGALSITQPSVLRVGGFAEGQPVTPIATRQFWIGPLPADPALMVAVDPQLLYDKETGILPNFRWHRRWRYPGATVGGTLQRQRLASRPSPGKLWEPVAHLLVVDSTGVLHDGPVGLQRHSDDQLRIAARPSLGTDHLPATLLQPALEPAPRTLIIDPEVIGWVDQVVYDMIRAAGGVAPRSRVVRLLLNGQPAAEPAWTPGIARLFERVDDRFLLARWGHANFDLIKGSPFQVRLGSAVSFDRLVRRLERPGWTLKDVERLVDIDRLIVLNFTLAFLAPQTLDGSQGYLAFDRSQDPPFLRPIAWDADHSFRNLELDMLARWGPDLQRGGFGYESRFLPVRMVLHLIEHDAGFRDRYLRHAERMLNHVFTLGWWGARRHAFGWAEQPDAVDMIERFLRERPARVRRSLASQLKTPLPHRVHVAVQGPGRLMIDGVPYDGAYEGYYFPGGVLEVSVPENLQEAFRGLTVNGQPVVVMPYRRTVDEALEVEARFAK